MPGTSWPELHGAFTHFPVALLITACAFELGSVVLRRPAWRMVSFWLLVGGVILAVPSLAAGWMTASTIFGGHARPPSIFPQHRLAALVTTGIAALVLAWRVQRRDEFEGRGRAGVMAMMVLIAIGIGYVGFLGGRMVFGGIGADAAEQPAVSATAGAPEVAGAPTSPIDPASVARGAALFQQNHCMSCHSMAGRGAGVAPDLTHEALRHADPAWHLRHLRSPQAVHPGSGMPSFDDLPPDQLQALADYLATRR